MRPHPQIPEQIEDHHDEHWHREGLRQIETALDAERFIEQIGFAACLVDSRRPGPSLYVAVCGRRDWDKRADIWAFGVVGLIGQGRMVRSMRRGTSSASHGRVCSARGRHLTTRA